MITPERFVHYKINIPNIDTDHYEILFQMSEISRHASIGNFDGAFDAVLLTKKEMTAHFTKEEAYMLAINFTFVNHHISEHATILQAIDSVIHKMSVTRNVYLVNALSNDLEILFINHIDYFDQQYVSFTNTHPSSQLTTY